MFLSDGLVDNSDSQIGSKRSSQMNNQSQINTLNFPAVNIIRETTGVNFDISDVENETEDEDSPFRFKKAK